MPPGRTRSTATRRSSSCSSGSGSPRQRRSGRELRTPSPEHGASTSARSKPPRSSGSSRASAFTTVERRAEPLRVRLQLARPARVLLDRDHLGAGGRELRRLAARAPRRGRASRSPGTRADRRPRELRAAALRPGVAALEPLRRDRVDDLGPLRRAHGRLGRLVLRPHERPRVVGPELAPPGLRDPVGIGVHERGSGRRLLVQAREQARQALGEPAHDRVREGDGALEPRGPDELDGLVARPRAPARRP